MSTWRPIIRVSFLLASFILSAVHVYAADLAPTDPLQKKIDQILERAGLSATRTRYSIQIVSIPDGQVLYERNPDLALNPASNVKLVTMATTLKELGPSFTFKTEFYSDTLIDHEGRIQNLWIKGSGDPLFVTEQLDSVVQRFKAAGLKGIDGQVFVDDTAFDRNNLTTYIADVDERLYKVFTGPLAFNFNSIRNKSGRGLQGVPDPALYTGTAIKEALQRNGIRISGGVRREAVPSRALLLLSHSSPPLTDILKSLGKFSNNFTAEQLVKAISANHFGPPGSTPKGLKLLRAYLESLGIPQREFALDNGSGLTRLSRISASQFVRLLFDLYTSPWRDDFIASLSIAGRDGTMARKLTGGRVAGNVFAKTGTLNGVSALSGYLFETKCRLAFSFLFNDFNTSLETLARTEEDILEAVLDERP